MNFYTYNFFLNQSNNNNFMRYLLFICLLILLLLTILKKFKSNNKMKFRDLTLLFSLLIIFIVGLQINEFKIGQKNRADSSQMLTFIKNISLNQDIKEDDIAINSTYIHDGMLIKLDSSYFLVSINNDNSSFKLEETFLMNNDVNIIRK